MKCWRSCSSLTPPSFPPLFGPLLQNHDQAVRTPLAAATDADQLLPSLAPMWEEEKARCGGNIPPRPGSPPRDPKPLCAAVEAVRAELKV